MEKSRQVFEETAFERQCRHDSNFNHVEDKLLRRWDMSQMSLIDRASALLGAWNPFTHKAEPAVNQVWLLDNTAYRPIHPYPHDPQPWQAEFVTCFFHTGRKEVAQFVSNIADQIGLDGAEGADVEAKQRIAERIRPFIEAIAPARSLDVVIHHSNDQTHRHTLGPSNQNGISSQVVLTGGDSVPSGTTVHVKSADNLFPNLDAHMHFASPEGWAIISDIDDTIKITQTVDPIGILKTTFADIPQPTQGMPDFYKLLDSQFKQPAWFYLSASPYNLYPFLHQFIHDHYHPGTIILRENSWMFLGGLLQSLTQGTQAYKTDRMAKIHDWLPRRKFICIGDSTQTDPESYAELFKKHPDWIKAIYIRVVTDAPHMEDKNKPERFQKAFEGVPDTVWKLFHNPDDELAEHVKNIAAHG